MSHNHKETNDQHREEGNPWIPERLCRRVGEGLLRGTAPT